MKISGRQLRKLLTESSMLGAEESASRALEDLLYTYMANGTMSPEDAFESLLVLTHGVIEAVKGEEVELSDPYSQQV